MSRKAHPGDELHAEWQGDRRPSASLILDAVLGAPPQMHFLCANSSQLLAIQVVLPLGN